MFFTSGEKEPMIDHIPQEIIDGVTAFQKPLMDKTWVRVSNLTFRKMNDIDLTHKMLGLFGRLYHEPNAAEFYFYFTAILVELRRKQEGFEDNWEIVHSLEFENKVLEIIYEELERCPHSALKQGIHSRVEKKILNLTSNIGERSM